jgi:transposase
MSVDILNLPQYRVLKVDETEHDYHIYAEIAAERVACPHCRSVKIQRWGTREILFKDLPMHGKRVGMYVRARRLAATSARALFRSRYLH